MDMISVFSPITKSYEQEDGSVLVEGIITDSSLDLDQQRCDPDWLAKAVPTWFSVGNLREQHDSHRAVGKAIEHQDLGDGGHFIRGRVVDPVAVAKVKAGVFTGFSIGIMDHRLSKSVDAPNGVISDGRICEVSLVDFPCNQNCTLAMVKSAKPGMKVKSGDFDAERLLVRVEELVEKTTEAEKTEMTVTLGDALAPEQVARFKEMATEPAAEKAPSTSVSGSINNAEAGCGCCAMCETPGDGCCDMCVPSGEVSDVNDTPVAKAFDRDAAIALVTSTLAKAGATENSGVKVPPIPAPEELDDIMGAKAAIAIIAELIQSEASEMVCAPNEDYDIALLLQAVGALRAFICREKGEPGGGDTDGIFGLSADPDVEKAKYSADELRQMLKDGKAFKNPNGDPSYPIGDKQDLENAIHAVGRGSGDHDAIRAYIKRRASALGASNLIPDSWSGGSKAADAESTVADTVNAVGEPADEAVETGSPLDKAVTGEVAEKAAAVESDPEALVKALTAALEKADSPLRKTFEAIVEAATETTAKSVSELTERVVRVESMPIPGGPALRRTDNEQKSARVIELTKMRDNYRTIADNSNDVDARKGYAGMAAEIDAQINSL